MHGWGILYLDKYGKGFKEAYVGSFMDGEINGVGVRNKENKGY
jgi:hypothetical protein